LDYEALVVKLHGKCCCCRQEWLCFMHSHIPVAPYRQVMVRTVKNGNLFPFSCIAMNLY
jgi:hypothetical protein